MTRGGPLSVMLVGPEKWVGPASKVVLEEAGRFQVERISNPEGVLEQLEEERNQFDCLVCHEGVSEPFQFVRRVRSSHPGLPILLGVDRESTLTEDALEAGVTDIVYGEASRILPHRIERVVEAARTATHLEERERMFDTLVANVEGMAYRCRNEADWPMEYLGDGCRELTGYEPEALVSGDETWGNLIHPDDRDRAWETVQSTLETYESFEVTYRIETRDGETRWCWERGRAITDGNGATHLEGYITDVTERKQRVEDLERYRTLVENVGDPMYMLDAEGVIIMVNDAMAEHLGHERKDILGEYPTTFMPVVDVEKGTEVIAALLASEDKSWQAWEMDAIRADGTRFRNEIVSGVIYDGRGQYAGSVGVVRDIQERKERERELERYETIIQAVGDPVYALDEDGLFTLVNEALATKTGYSREELEGEFIGTVVHDAGIERGREYIRELLGTDGDHTVKYEILLQPKDGEEIPCELQMALLGAEEFAGTAGVIRDITERKRREERLEEFASVVSHDLRNPLTVISGQLELARRTGEDEHFEKIADATGWMEELIESLLSLARQGKMVGETESVELEAVATEAWEGMDTTDAALQTGGEEPIQADPERLRELLANLFRNAVEHGGESVTVTVGTTDRGFVVTDDGAGIDPEKRDTVFEHGYTSTTDGTGIGLAIVRRIAEAHGWTTSLGESDGGGARFEFQTE